MLPSSRPPGRTWAPLAPFHQLEQRLPHIQPLLLSAFDQVSVDPIFWAEFDFLVGPKCAMRLHNLTFPGSASRQGPAPATSNAKRSRWCSFVNQQHFPLSSHFQARCLEPYCLPLLWVTAQAGESLKMTMKTGVDTKSTNQAQSGEHQFH